MVFVGVVLVLAVLGGYLAGGRLRRLAHLDLRWPWLAVLAVVAQLVIAPLPDGLAVPLLVASQLLLLAFILANHHLPGAWLIALGFALNAVVIDLNGGMPVAAEALRWLGGETAVDPGKHRLLADGDLLTVLADVIPVPGLRIVISVGDLVLAAGVAWLVAAGMRRAPSPPAGASPAASPGSRSDRPAG